MRRFWRWSILAVSLLAASSPASAAALALDGDGGDAWSFHKRIAGHVIDGACETVTIATPAGDTPARLSGTGFAAEVTLYRGDNSLSAQCWRKGKEIAASPPQHWVERLRDAPEAQARILVADGLALDGSESAPAAGHAVPIRRYEWQARPGNPAPLFAEGHGASLDRTAVPGARLALAMPAADGTYYVTLRVTDALGRSDESTAAFRVEQGVAKAVALSDAPRWIDDAVVYGAVPRLFGRRGLADLTDRLDAIAALGATVLWLSPITGSPPGDFGYAVTDQFHLRREVGSEADLRALIAAAHARGLKVVLDLAVNHLSDRHPYFRDAMARGDASAYRDFFARDAAGRPQHYFDWTNLENLNYGDPEVRNYVIAAFVHWVRDFDVDGFRVDAAWGVRERAPDFWPRWRAALKRIKPDLLLLAEASARDPYYRANGFDAAYDWSAQLGQWSWHGAFDGPAVARHLRAALAGESDARRTFRFLDNNDTGKRFFTRHGAGLTRVAAAMLMTLPGIPAVYMGDEVGADFLPYAAAAPISWTDAAGLYPYYRKIIALRHREPALRSPALTLVPTSDDDDVLAYLRPAAGGGEDVLVVLNYSAGPVTVFFRDGATLASVLGTGSAYDLLAGETVALDRDAPQLSLPPLSARVLRRAPAS